MDPRDETTSLISAEKVIGTNVYNAARESLGEIADVMIDKRSGQIAYAHVIWWISWHRRPLSSPSVVDAKVRYRTERLCSQSQ